MSDVAIILDENVERSCLRHLQQEALNCLQTFPKKVIELNDLVNDYIPRSVKNANSEASATNLLSNSPSTVSSFTKDCESATNAGLDATSYASLTTYDRGRSTRGIYKRKYYRIHGSGGFGVRRKPSPLGQILTFIASRLAVCSKNIVIAPSRFVIDGIVSTFFPKREVKNVQCGTSLDWQNSLSDYVTTLKKDSTLVGSFISVMRPAAVQLIADTTVLKRWLQALALSDVVRQSSELTNVARNVETIDSWAYELFFHLKQLQTARERQNRDETLRDIFPKATVIYLFHEFAFKVNNEDPKFNDEIAHANLWHRLVQLRDNYIILYEILQKNGQIRDLVSRRKKPK